MNFKIFINILFFSFIFLVSCRKENGFDCFKGVGKHTTEYRNLSSFQIIKIELVGGENIIGLVSSNIANNELIIRNNNKCNWSRSYKKSIITLNIHFTKLDSLYILGECDLFSKDTLYLNKFRLDVKSVGTIDLKVKAHNFIFWPIGNGDFKISGNTDYYFLGSVGSGNIYCTEFKSHFTQIASKSTANSYIYSDGILIIDDIGYGNIFYSGNPDSINIKQHTGTGQLIQLN